MDFIKLVSENSEDVLKMSQMATLILRDYYDPILGKEQNDYMLEKFQSVNAIKEQLKEGYQYFFVKDNDIDLGFVAFYPKEDFLYLSKFYLYKEARGKGYARGILDFLISETKKLNLKGIELNVNKYNVTCKIYEKLGFRRIRSEKNDIGQGYFMDDYVYFYDVPVL